MKKIKYSIRKLSVGTASVAICALIAGMLTYVQGAEITPEENLVTVNELENTDKERVDIQNTDESLGLENNITDIREESNLDSLSDTSTGNHVESKVLNSDKKNKDFQKEENANSQEKMQSKEVEEELTNNGVESDSMVSGEDHGNYQEELEINDLPSELENIYSNKQVAEKQIDTDTLDDETLNENGQASEQTSKEDLELDFNQFERYYAPVMLMNNTGGASISTRGLTTAQINFLNSLKSGAIESWRKYGVLPSIVAAQGIIESGWGGSDLATKGKNLFGIKATGNEPYILMPTREETPNGDIYINAKFRKYNSWADSIEDHGKFLAENSRYRSLLGEKDYVKVANILQNVGYATDSRYANSLIGVIQSYNLFAWDQEAISGYTGGTTTPVTPEPEPSNGNTYTVKAGDSLWGIGQKFGVSVDQLKSWNNLGTNYMLHPGDQLIVSASTGEDTTPTPKPTPTKEKTYTVKAGDSLWGISQKFGVSVDQLKEWNNLGSNYMLHPGDQLLVSASTGGTATPAPEPTPTNGKTYTVKAGDSLWGISQRFGVSVDQLKSWNNLGANYMLHPGDQLLVSASTGGNADSITRPSSTKTYTVKAGDSLWGISQRFGVSIDQVKSWNNLGANYMLHPGDQLIIK
ncbi:LysM peptidoglycan-binding domain-containing protein [Aerococcus sanguinicola]|uniref:LysM peptidoglycan-binding domain-containing protein n=1 Tax=Aerococcus sanguinicola TaxID=119206 RepID=UPI0018A75781|nr:LysM peptidoglycan-binding domain-containing protein [Aerococcus sanguinicola]